MNFEDISIDPYWNIGGQKENPMHRIHAYPAKFPAFITSKALKYAQENNIDISNVADIFCGCGTVAYETAREGKNFWGCDINPVATLIARSKSKKYLDKQLAIYNEEVISHFRSIQDRIMLPQNERILYWFQEQQIIDLIKLKMSIKQVIPRGKYLDFFLCAFSNILKPTSVWLTKSIKPQVDPVKIIPQVLDVWDRQITMMRQANQSNDITQKTKIAIETVNFLKKKIDSPFIDIIITSPPYVTSYEYADLHQLSTLWLDYVTDYKELRDGTIGSLYHQSNFYADVSKLNDTARSIVNKLCIANKSKAKSAARYYADMQKSIEKSYALLNNGGMALYVIGNTEYKTVRIDNAKHLVESMFDAGFTQIEICKRNVTGKILTPYRDDSGRFTKDHSCRKVYSEEFIIIGHKKWQS